MVAQEIVHAVAVSLRGLRVAELGGDQEEIGRDLDEARALSRAHEEALRLEEAPPGVREVAGVVLGDAEVVENGRSIAGGPVLPREVEGALKLHTGLVQVQAPESDMTEAGAEHDLHPAEEIRRALERVEAFEALPAGRIRGIELALEDVELGQLRIDQDQLLLV